LIAALRLLSYRQVAALLLTIFVGVVLVDGLGSRLRQAMK
jgi:ABC-type phosphate/phosphonate transport system permease subunit